MLFVTCCWREISQYILISTVKLIDLCVNSRPKIFSSAFPRYALEALGMVAIAILGFLLVSQRGSGASVIPLLGVLALGAQRLLPALQQLYSGWANLKAYSASIQDVLVMLNQPLSPLTVSAEPIRLRESINLQCVSFRYDQDKAMCFRT